MRGLPGGAAIWFRNVGQIAAWLVVVSLAVVAGLPAQSSPDQTTLREPAIAGDHPDPTVIRVGEDYWAASTSGDWAPSFPLFRSHRSPDDWKQVGSIFPDPPSWAQGDFWAPELVNDRGHILVYYAARNRDGVLCVAVATASLPRGPYADHGPLVCQPDGSIDPSFARDRDGQPYLIWKEDGNSRKQPTPIWAQPLSSDGLKLEGVPKELIKNDAPWEGRVVEAPYILRHGDWFYLFYAGSGCCGAACNYAEGVARSRSLLGPWQKDPANPIIHDGDGWRCPGHGTAVEGPGLNPHTWLLFHAYSDSGGVYVARESVMVPIDWKDDWPQVRKSEIPAANRPVARFEDDFSKALAPGWQWPLAGKPFVESRDRELVLATAPGVSAAMIGRVIEGPSYTADVVLERASLNEAAVAGLAILGGRRASVGIGWQQGRVVLWTAGGAKQNIVASSPAPVVLPVELRVEASQPAAPRFSWRRPGGQWTRLQGAVESSSLLGWDSGLRLGLAVAGSPGSRGVFRTYSQTAGSAADPGERPR